MKRLLFFGSALAFLLMLLAALPGLANPEFTCADVTEIPQLECEALVALYNSTNGTGWANNTNWLVINAPSTWYGVTVESGHVTRLQLYYQGLIGTIPAELGNLSSLMTLDLHGNALNEPIPSELGNLSNLWELILNNNYLSGAIPPQIGNLTNLRMLLLDVNHLSGDVPGSFVNLVNLYDPGGSYYGGDGLDLSYNLLNVPADYPDPDIPLHVFLYQKDPDWHLEQLEFFTSCADVTEIPQLECEALVALYNSTNGSGWYDNANWLVNNKPSTWSWVIVSSGHVIQLRLSGNNLSGTLPAELGNLSELDALYLHDNLLSGSIPTEMGNLRRLESLWLRNNQLSGSIPAELGNLISLTHLFLQNNQLSGSIPMELGNLFLLWTLDLSSNRLSGFIPAELGNLSSLYVLRLNNNQLTGDIPESFVNLVNLEDPGTVWGGGDGLDLDYNMLNIPANYPDPSIPLQVFLSQKDLEWHTRQVPVDHLDFFLPLMLVQR